MTDGHPRIGAVGRHAELDRVPNNMFERAAGSHALAAAAQHDRSADQEESATTMTIQAVICGRGEGLPSWDGL